MLVGMYTSCGVQSAGLDENGGDPYLAIPLAQASSTSTFYLCNKDSSSQ